jgi:hypothetical protein
MVQTGVTSIEVCKTPTKINPIHCGTVCMFWAQVKLLKLMIYDDNDIEVIDQVCIVEFLQTLKEN